MPTPVPYKVINQVVWLRSGTIKEGEQKTTNTYHPKKSRGKNEKSNFIFGDCGSHVDRLCNDAGR
jgi:hypothetical protein